MELYLTTYRKLRTWQNIIISFSLVIAFTFTEVCTSFARWIAENAIHYCANKILMVNDVVSTKEGNPRYHRFKNRQLGLRRGGFNSVSDEAFSSYSERWRPVAGNSDKNCDSPDPLCRKSVDPYEPQSGISMALPPSCSDSCLWK